MTSAFFHLMGPFDTMSCARMLLAPDIPAAVKAWKADDQKLAVVCKPMYVDAGIHSKQR